MKKRMSERHGGKKDLPCLGRFNLINVIKRAAAVCAVLMVFAASLPDAEIAYASGETAYFGSESYTWELSVTNPIGIYGAADGELSSIECSVVYDAEMLEYVEGGSSYQSGSVYVYADGIADTVCKQLIYFSPLIAGDTAVTIEDMTITGTDGTVTTLDEVSVTVSVTIPTSCQLSSIYIDGELIEGFDPLTASYDLGSDADLSTAEISASAYYGDAQILEAVTEDDVTTVYIEVTGSDGYTARYTLTSQAADSSYLTDTQEDETLYSEDEESLYEEEEEEAQVTIITDVEEETVEEGPLYGFTSALKNAVRYGLRKARKYARKIKPIHVVFAAVAAMLFAFSYLAEKEIRRARERQRRIEERKGRYRAAQERVPYENKASGEDTGGAQENTPQAQEEKAAEDAAKEAAKTPGTQDKGQAGEASAKDPAVTAAAAVAAASAGAAAAQASSIKYEITPEEYENAEIVVSHVSIDFKREKDESSSFKEYVIRLIKRQHEIVYFRALDDISFTVAPGEVVGIVGTNGSGKSTLLKIVSGALEPTEGEVKVDRGKVQLLTLGTGFDRELTGKENVYLNGAIIGYTREFIDEHYDSIVAFAELEGFMDERVKNYSSGMVSRLGFAIATAGDAPGILILDEVLSVGDMFFRKKSEKRIKELIHGGSTVLIVSHSTSVIRSNCTRAVWIEKSKLKMVGTAKEVCAAYEKYGA